MSLPPQRSRPESGPEGAAPLRRLAFPAFGTRCDIQYGAPLGDRQADAFAAAAFGWVTAFEEKYSRFRPDSIISRINAAAGREWVEIDAETEDLLTLCDTLYRMTKGVLDPTVLPLLRCWDYKSPRPQVPSEAAINAARELVGWDKVQRAPGGIYLPTAGMALDFGGFGKEYAVDRVAQLALERGLTSALVDFGHDLRAVGVPPGYLAWHVGLEDPRRPGETCGSIAVTDRGVACSGDYLRCFRVGDRRYGHIIDPRTGYPVSNGSLQTTVVAATCLQAGVLSTTAFVLGVPAGIDFIQSFPGAEGLIVTERVRAQTRRLFEYVVT